LNTLSTTTIPTITSTIRTQRSLSLQITTDNLALQEQQSNQYNEMHQRFEDHQISINKLYDLVYTLQNSQSHNSQTPNSRPRKKPNSTQNSEIPLNQETIQNNSMEEVLQDTPPSQPQQQPQLNRPNLHQLNTQTNTAQLPSPNNNDSSPYSSVYNLRNMTALSPINITSPTNEEEQNNPQNIIDLTTQSTHQNDSEVITPRNLNNSFPTPMRETKNNTTMDLGNLYPGNNT
jgi:hypothetical protein